ncbi:hypothetical protein K502DRAFT_323330 [Neoconidiobolus thromboides FSU 785]|nr:hypothetical protein K502DRAFT_323330 [Neoconidiobolus thromboides FSU 785]
MKLTHILNQDSTQSCNSTNLPSIRFLFPSTFTSSREILPSFDFGTTSYSGNQSYIVDTRSTSPEDNQEQKVKIRNRRKYIEIERVFKCNHTGCTKSYGALNHLNTHVILKNHGPKRSPQEFKKFKKCMRMVQFNYSLAYN